MREKCVCVAGGEGRGKSLKSGYEDSKCGKGRRGKGGGE